MKVLEGWDKKTLRDLATINYGKSPIEILAPDGPYPVVGTGGAERLGDDYLYEGDSIILGRKGTIDRVHFATGRFWTIDTAYYLSDFAESVPLWLFYFLQTIDLRQMNEATGVPSLSRDTLYKIEVSTPPKPEQTKIAEILSTVDRAIEQTEALIAKQQRIKTGLMQDLLTHGIDEHGNLRSEQTHQFKDSPLGRIPVEWDCTLLSRFVPSAEYGISTSLGESGNPVLRMNNFFKGEADIFDLKYTDLKVPEKLWLRDGDVLFNRTNSWEHVGRTGIWRGQVEKATFASYLVRLNPDPNMLLSELLNVWLNWEPTQVAMRRLATPAVQQVNINPTNLRGIHAAFPSSLNEQCEIVKRFTSMRNTISSCFESFKKLRSLKTALMADLLTGKVRVTPLLEKKEVGV
ncbi:MAG: restriction endonuclease subunit S [Desulfobacterales bacterium]|nr:restriction endonuclease subunit S [Desulfobacterales bacterium]